MTKGPMIREAKCQCMTSLWLFSRRGHRDPGDARNPGPDQSVVRLAGPWTIEWYPQSRYVYLVGALCLTDNQNTHSQMNHRRRSPVRSGGLVESKSAVALVVALEA